MLTSSKVIFGAPWSARGWSAVDDRVRGGSSISHLDPIDDGRRARFWGTLDTKTLGGAGFASQSYLGRLRLARSSYAGLEVRYAASTAKEGQPTRFVITLKQTEPEKRSDGRIESRTSYEYRFDAASTSSSTVTKLALWSDFEPTYRGRAQPDAPALDPAQIRELSVMCRSDFARQEGDFELFLISISAVSDRANSDSEKAASSGWTTRLWVWLRAWYDYLLVRRPRDGHVKL
ncbi:uncharacterized protein L969DRAFT_92879 [Mixia osmundae IAM 14324]|uniref:NADH:ubiquinone oxidoreductase intermediate-associated protein 30 domain-containing protein n=1 Tax=Mixia osmundae (strain CBS 9802 / IAM 14324 / JCM 22182 / KY 12970) TaxID=764103 RepID=G7DYU5_MIXOS|nr:uncharacterized protein L969DRAFT_92879 [Mixia osmundae IAM 14324]KEI41651.1 hypothetical protein L969DRAFT_92879 [Mixia osmundae IAM 14324]GAA95755.1 hypothetical protein E5Q_02412 [Mixia osmundae IAM 14324]